ncbi:hypothetical protein ACQPWW_26620 [Micromonospora sp. CA-240977]|uniref:hypothetical protein n=1 Tax=Micromonospora sp. CA-240977 TaxID=3239957 RepID=UPI003D93BC1B
MEARFTLRKIVAGLAHIAEVAAVAEPAEHDQVVVSPHAFDWLRDRYGPQAVVDRTTNAELIAEALAGARYALAHVPGRDRAMRVTLMMIGDSPVDTCDGDIKLAAAEAVAAALGGRMDPAPYLGANGAVFPD